jgi:hypothetical protein
VPCPALARRAVRHVTTSARRSGATSVPRRLSLSRRAECAPPVQVRRARLVPSSIQRISLRIPTGKSKAKAGQQIVGGS